MQPCTTYKRCKPKELGSTMTDKIEPPLGEMHYYRSILETMGNTPLVRLSRVVSDVPPLVLAKMEMFNPGGSVKDRIGPAMIAYCENRPLLRPGGTIVHPTIANPSHRLPLTPPIHSFP